MLFRSKKPKEKRPKKAVKDSTKKKAKKPQKTSGDSDDAALTANIERAQTAKQPQTTAV